MKLSVLILFILVSILIVSCDQYDTKFVVINNTESTKSYYFSEDSTSNSAITFFSELFHHKFENQRVPKDFSYLNSKSKDALYMLGPWEDYLDRQFPDSTAYLYLIDSSDIGKKPEIMNRDNLVSRYRVTSKYMRENNWELIIN